MKHHRISVPYLLRCQSIYSYLLTSSRMENKIFSWALTSNFSLLHSSYCSNSLLDFPFEERRRDSLFPFVRGARGVFALFMTIKKQPSWLTGINCSNSRITKFRTCSPQIVKIKKYTVNHFTRIPLIPLIYQGCIIV